MSWDPNRCIVCGEEKELDENGECEDCFFENTEETPSIVKLGLLAWLLGIGCDE